MDPRIETALDEWRIRACDPGYAGLHALADADFTGGVTTEEAVGFMVNGRLVGVAGGSTESFWGADFTALEADGPALPLPCAMLSSNGDEEGEYYTGETPIADVDETLGSGSFTGYIELSENVFSGDYFVVYYGGRSFDAAFLGTEDRIVTGDEARERAAEEVGIYTVNNVSVSVLDIPDPEVDDSVGGGTPEPVEEEPNPPSTDTTEDPPQSAVEGTAEPSTDTEEPVEAESASAPSDRSDVAQLAEAALGTDPSSVGTSTDVGAEQTNEWVAIPALDPSRTGSLEEPGRSQQHRSVSSSSAEPNTSTEVEADTPDEDAAELQSELADAREENDRLHERIEELQATVAELEAEETTGEELPPSAALSGTNLFVRYETSSNFTLDEAIEGTASREDVAGNLRLERHTTFDRTEVTVDGEPFDAFLEDTTAYQFSQWILAELTFDLVDGGDAKGYAGLIEIIPDIDRIEFGGEIPVHTQEGGDRQSHTYAFDLVFRNSMGDPVLVADVEEGRSPIEGEAIGDLLSESNSIATHRSSLRGAFFVCRSYFEPEALETVADATSGGFLRGGSKKSYVSVSRKRGFHLCLVEARDGTFHLNTPSD